MTKGYREELRKKWIHCCMTEETRRREKRRSGRAGQQEDQASDSSAQCCAFAFLAETLQRFQRKTPSYVRWTAELG